MSRIKEAIIITGGVKRLGLVFARKTLEMGYRVILHYHTSIDTSAEKLANEYPGDVVFIQKELAENPEILIRTALDYGYPVCGLVNNASIFTTGNMTDMTHFENVLKINTFAPARLSTEFQKCVGKGWIINISDSHIKKVNLNYQNYRISKIMLEELTRQQAILFAPHIRVNAIAPGAMIPSKDEENIYFAGLEQKIPLQSIGNIDALTNAYSFLINNNYITGHVLPVDGGWSLI